MLIAQHKPQEKEYWYNHITSKSFDERVSMISEHDVINTICKYAKKESIIIEGGCSDGIYLSRLKELGYINVSGFDTDKKLLSIAKKMNVAAKYGSIKKIPCNNSSVNLFLDHGLVEHFSLADQKMIFQEIHQKLKLGGYLLTTFAYLNSFRKLIFPYLKLKNEYYYKLIKKYPFYQFIYTKTAMKNILISTQFKIVEFNEYSPSRALFVAKSI